MSRLDEMVRLREWVDSLCAAMDAGEVEPTEDELRAIAWIVSERAEPGLLRHDLLCKLASRSIEGRAVLRKLAQ